MVYGVTGSGKSTLAAKIAERTGLPYHSVDDLTWNPGWTEVPLEEQIARIDAIVSGDEWVLDTAYAKWRDRVIPRVELVVGLDYPTVFTFFRLLRRCILRLFDGATICNGNRESLTLLLSRDSLLLWFFKSYKAKRQRIRQWAAERPEWALDFRRPRDTEAWLQTL